VLYRNATVALWHTDHADTDLKSGSELVASELCLMLLGMHMSNYAEV
jgi:hypothetical protein